MDRDRRKKSKTNKILLFVIAIRLKRDLQNIVLQKSQCWFLFIEGSIKHVTAGFALFTVIKTRSSVN